MSTYFRACHALSILLTIALCLSILLPAAVLASGPETVDRLVAVDQGCPAFALTDLLAGPTFARTIQLEILDPPAHGTLTLAPNAFTYEPDASPECAFDTLESPWIDSFEYRLWINGVPTAPSRTLLQLTPRFEAITGRWPTATCPTLPCSTTCNAPSTLGLGYEIGFYDHLTSAFLLCDLEAGNLSDCQRRALTLGASGGSPLVMDTNGDGRDELALRDPVNGELHWLRETPCGQGETCLETDWIQAAPGADQHALSGDWWGASTAHLGFFDPVSDQWTFLNGGAVGALLGFGFSGTESEPLAGDWLDTGADTPALYHYPSHTLFAAPDLVGSGWIGHPMTEHFVMPRGQAFSGRTSQCVGAPTYLGLWDAGSRTLRLRVFDDGDTTIHVAVPADPDCC